MKKFWFILALCLAAVALRAQIAVDVLMDQEQFLRDESLSIRVRINNLSGQTITLGKDPEWLTFQVENLEGAPVEALGQISLQEEHSLESAKAAIRKIDLMPYFNLSRLGRYSVTAKVKVGRWDKEFYSKPKTFEIINGFKIWEQPFGVPGTNSAPEVRKYLLQQANYLKRLMLYVRITDANEAQTFRVLQVGPLVSFSKPEALLDKESNLHVLFQTGGWTFFYYVIDPQGNVKVRQRHDYTHTRPVLRAMESGHVKVSGGVRRINDDDLPPPGSDDSDNHGKEPKP